MRSRAAMTPSDFWRVPGSDLFTKIFENLQDFSPAHVSAFTRNHEKDLKNWRAKTLSGEDAMLHDEQGGPRLPTGKAFVLQLSRDTGSTLRPFAGRLEHLSTGRRERFETLEDFLTALTRLLAKARDE